MASHAATATGSITFSLTPIIALIVVTLGYIGLCWLRPFRRCPACHGTGATTTRILRRARPCRRCAGEGWRLRHGRRLANHLRHLHHNANPPNRGTLKRGQS